jgi:hypothetical protein
MEWVTVTVSHNAMKMLVGDEVLVHPKPISRLIFSNCGASRGKCTSGYEFMSGGLEFFTACIPLHDCQVEVGPL